MKRIFFAGTLSFALLASCKKDDTSQYNSSIKAGLTVEFDNIAGSTDLQLNTATYTNASAESFKVTKLKYYVSNFILTNVDGTVFTVPQDSCYFLIDESDAATHSPLLKIPEGEYKTLSFTLGVDSLRNTMDISKRTGVLDPTGIAADMYWGWNSGYIFFKLEGTSPSSPAPGNLFAYHIGGFGGYSTPTANNSRKITIDLTARGTARIKTGSSSNIHLMVDILKALNGATNMSFATVPAIHSIPGGIPVANNYSAMFKHDHTENF